ncbi:MAG: hypothetical protein CMM25_02430 [Rhodospirillaceae bacterium]|nr:hypothetical protein [Rhodospirillaceae bacterium]
MKTNSLALIGKKYIDTILSVDVVLLNETNDCSLTRRKGGIHNFFDIRDYKLKIKTFEFGKKEAFVINENNTSSRTSFVRTLESSKVPPLEIKHISESFDWAHICYLDDLEDYGGLYNLSCPFSIDFCTNKDRSQYVKLMNKSEIIFDSRERRALYDNCVLESPLLLHDEEGVEVIISGKTIYKNNIKPVQDLSVNGAGDIYAGFFIENYFKKNLKDSARYAMIETTKVLMKRRNNEEV